MGLLPAPNIGGNLPIMYENSIALSNLCNKTKAKTGAILDEDAGAPYMHFICYHNAGLLKGKSVCPIHISHVRLRIRAPCNRAHVRSTLY